MHLNDIIKGCQKYDKKAQFELVKRYSERLRSTCNLYVIDKTSAKDVLQESFMIIFSKIESYSDKGSFEGWMRMITVRCALAWIKKHKRFTKTDEAICKPFVLAPKVYDSLHTKDIIDFIQNLPEAQRLVFSLFVIEGYSHTEISKQLGIKEATSRSHLLRARKLLQKRILLTDIKIDRAV